MTLLAIDTSTALSSVAVFCDGALYFRVGNKQQSHAAELGELVELTLKDSGGSPAEIQRVIIGSGPGSFTGLRIGYAFAKGLAYALQVPLQVASSFRGAAVAAQQEQSSGRAVEVVVAFDARREEVFLARYSVQASGDSLERECPRIVAKREITLTSSSGDEVLFIGDQPGALPAGPIALGLLLSSSRDRDANLQFNLEEISKLRPNYLRAVSAKTIAERGSPK